jgi:glycosyltransferase involved in cell wall biosynthesis
MAPVLSICILTYNRESYLSELLSSIVSLEEKYLKQLEVVIINNGSTDDTDKALNPYSKRNNFSIINFTENKRGSSIYLQLVNKAKGEFLIFPGDDDVFITKSIIDLIEACNMAETGISLIAFGAKTIDSDGKSNLSSYSPPVSENKSELIAKLLFDSVFWMPATAVRRVIISNSYDPLTITAFDWWIWLTAACNGDIKRIEIPIINYRQHVGQEQKSFLKLNWEIDSFLMLRRIIVELVTPWLAQESSASRSNFLNQVSKNLLKVNFDQYQIIKWTMIMSIFSQSFEIKEIINQTKFASLIWNDPRFVETWFNFEMTTEQIIDFYIFWGISTKLINNSHVYPEDKSESLVKEKKSLTIYKNEENGVLTYIISLAVNGNNYNFSGLSEPQFRSKLKEMFSYILVDYREVENMNQITPMERKILQVFRKLKTYKIFNLVR